MCLVLKGQFIDHIYRALKTDDIKALGIDMLPGYQDPWAKRTLTKGEIGCFLSHYYIWQEVKILFQFEDDLCCSFFFVHQLFSSCQSSALQVWMVCDIIVR